MRTIKNLPRLFVDLNELIEPNLYLISNEDTKIDIDNQAIRLIEGLEVELYGEGLSEDPSNMESYGKGIVELNRANDWSKRIKWCVRFVQQR
jgi:hypothetical protein